MAKRKIETTELEAIAKALRDALMAYDELETQGTSRAAIAQRLFGVAATPTLLPQLDEIAKHVRPD
jgi:hypothetical protein